MSLCGVDSDCAEGFFCGKALLNPSKNLLNFDTFPYAFIQVYQSVTLEGWVQIMYFLQLTTNRYVWVFNFVLVFLGSFFIINLVLAVVAINFL
jgi:hypothetical protein